MDKMNQPPQTTTAAQRRINEIKHRLFFGTVRNTYEEIIVLTKELNALESFLESVEECSRESGKCSNNSKEAD